MPPDERLLRLENAFSTLAELAKAQSGIMDEYKRRTDELAKQAEVQRERSDSSERRIELLIELAAAQNVRIKEGERLMEEIRQTMREVVEAQNQTEAHLSILSTIVAEMGRRSGGKAEGHDTA